MVKGPQDPGVRVESDKGRGDKHSGEGGVHTEAALVRNAAISAGTLALSMRIQVNVCHTIMAVPLAENGANATRYRLVVGEPVR